MDGIEEKDQETLDRIEEKLLEKDRKKKEEKMIVEGRSVFDVKKKKENIEHNRH